jgi:hypothetical protein
MVTRLGRSLAVLVAVLTIAAITGFVLMAMSASAAGGKGGKGGGGTSTISIQTSAQLSAGGKGGSLGVDVTVKYSCFPAPGYGKGGYASDFGNVTVGDLNGTSGSGFFLPVCNDKKNTAVVFVPGTFAAGDAAANAFVCGFDCAFVSKEIKIS